MKDEIYWMENTYENVYALLTNGYQTNRFKAYDFPTILKVYEKHNCAIISAIRGAEGVEKMARGIDIVAVSENIEKAEELHKERLISNRELVCFNKKEALERERIYENIAITNTKLKDAVEHLST